MRLSDRDSCRTLTTCLCVVMAIFLLAGRAWSDTMLLAWDVDDEDLWSIDTASPVTSTFIGGGNSSFISEIEYGFGVVYGADTSVNNSDLHMIDPSTGQIFDTITLAHPPQGDVITALEFVGGTLYAGLTTQGGGPTFLSTIDLISGSVTVVGDTGVSSPFGGLAYDMPSTTLYGISAGGSEAELFTIDMVTGAANSVGSVTLGGLPFTATALEFGDDGVLYTAPARTDPLFGDVLTIDPTTAVATDLGDAGLTQGAVALTFSRAIFTDGFESGDTTAWSSSQ